MPRDVGEQRRPAMAAQPREVAVEAMVVPEHAVPHVVVGSGNRDLGIVQARRDRSLVLRQWRVRVRIHLYVRAERRRRRCRSGPVHRGLRADRCRVGHRPNPGGDAAREVLHVQEPSRNLRAAVRHGWCGRRERGHGRQGHDHRQRSSYREPAHVGSLWLPVGLCALDGALCT